MTIWWMTKMTNRGQIRRCEPLSYTTPMLRWNQDIDNTSVTVPWSCVWVKFLCASHQLHNVAASKLCRPMKSYCHNHHNALRFTILAKLVLLKYEMKVIKYYIFIISSLYRLPFAPLIVDSTLTIYDLKPESFSEKKTTCVACWRLSHSDKSRLRSQEPENLTS